MLQLPIFYRRLKEHKGLLCYDTTSKRFSVQFDSQTTTLPATVRGKTFDTVSAAAQAFRKVSQNGWIQFFYQDNGAWIPLDTARKNNLLLSLMQTPTSSARITPKKLLPHTNNNKIVLKKSGNMYTILEPCGENKKYTADIYYVLFLLILQEILQTVTHAIIGTNNHSNTPAAPLLVDFIHKRLHYFTLVLDPLITRLPIVLSFLHRYAVSITITDYVYADFVYTENCIHNIAELLFYRSSITGAYTHQDIYQLALRYVHGM